MGYNRKVVQFKILLILWILFCNSAAVRFQIEFSWVVFVSNIMLFAMNDMTKEGLISVEFGGIIGLLMAFIAIQITAYFTPVGGAFISIMSVLTVTISSIILLNGSYPRGFNNISFIYFTCAFIRPDFFMKNFVVIVVIYIIGTLFVNCGAIIIWRKCLK